MNINMDDFEVIKPISHRHQINIVSIFKDGSVNFNGTFLEKFPTHEVEILLKRDLKQMIIKGNGDNIIKLPKNGRMKNYNIIDLIEKHNKRFPLYYVFEWEKNNNLWLGELRYDNPNKKRSKINKSL